MKPVVYVFLDIDGDIRRRLRPLKFPKSEPRFSNYAKTSGKSFLRGIREYQVDLLNVVMVFIVYRLKGLSIIIPRPLVRVWGWPFSSIVKRYPLCLIALDGVNFFKEGSYDLVRR